MVCVVHIGGGGVNSWKRVFNLYGHLFIIYLLAIPLGSLICPSLYPGSILKLLENFLGIRSSYNATQWFLLPYIILMVSSKWIFYFFDRLKPHVVGVMCLTIFIASVIGMKLIGVDTLSEVGVLYNIYLSFYMLFPFSLGYLAKRQSWFERIYYFAEKKHLRKNGLLVMLLISVSILRCCIANQTADTFYAFVFIIIFSMLNIPHLMRRILMFFGKHSMNMWLIHWWIGGLLFHDFVYSLKYPIIVFSFLLFASLIVSMVVEYIYQSFGKLSLFFQQSSK